MHDYTAQRIHDDRMEQFTREADAYRLASQVKGKPSGGSFFSRVAARWLRMRVAARSGSAGNVARAVNPAASTTDRSVAGAPSRH